MTESELQPPSPKRRMKPREVVILFGVILAFFGFASSLLSLWSWVFTPSWFWIRYGIASVVTFLIGVGVAFVGALD